MGKCEITKPEWLEIIELRKLVFKIFCDVINCRKVWLFYISFFVIPYFSVQYVLSSSFPVFSLKYPVYATKSKII